MSLTPQPAQQLAEGLLAAQKNALELLVTGAPLPEVLASLTRAVEVESGGGSVASILLLDEKGMLRNGASPSLTAEYIAAIDGLPARVGLGTCAHAAATGDVVITPSFAASKEWDGLSHYPLGIGLLGAWSMPIRARDGRVLGTFGTYFREVRGPTSLERHLVEVLTRTAAIAIERSRWESELVAAKHDAESASDAKGQFIAMISHELRTPLSGIIAYADLLHSEAAGPVTAQQIGILGRIRTGAWHLSSIIDQVISFSRSGPGNEEVTLENVNLATLVSECTTLMQINASAKGLTLHAVVPAGGLRAMSDAGKLRQILLNLTGNALKFTRRGDVTVVLDTQGGDARIRVSDSGPGIAIEDHERIFEPFTKLDQNDNGGLGLGLALSRRLAALLGGELVIASEPGYGTTISFLFPLSGPNPISLEAALMDSAPRKGSGPSRRTVRLHENA